MASKYFENCGRYEVFTVSTFSTFSQKTPPKGAPPSGGPILQIFKIAYDKQFLIFFDDSNAKSSEMLIYYRKKILHPVKKKNFVCFFFGFSIFRVFDVFLY